MTVLLRPQRFPSRSALAAVLLVLALCLAGVLAYQAFDATRSHRAIAQRTVKDYAMFAAWELSSAIRREIFSQYLAPGIETVSKATAYPSATEGKTFDMVKKVAEDVGWWAAGEDLEFVFRYLSDQDTLLTFGPVEPGAATREWLVGIIREHSTTAVLKLPGKSSLLLALHGTGEEERVVALAIGPFSEKGEPAGLGFQTTLKPLEAIVSKVEQSVPLLPPTITKGKRTSDVLSFDVHTRVGYSLFRSEPQFPKGASAGQWVGEGYGDLAVTVHLRPELAESLIIGGLPKSRLPFIFGLLALTAGLVVVSIFQIRREQELSTLRADFVSSVSHQLRTPLAQIRMFGETLLLGRVRSEDERQRSLEIIVKESQQLTRQVDNVLLFSRAQRNDVRLNPVRTPLAQLIRDELEGFCPLAEAQGCKVELHLDEALAAIVDPGSMSQILLNLMENAVKYGPRGQIVDVKLTEGPRGMARLVVEDEGEGIPPEKREAVFTPYARLDRDRDSGVAGSGIGLAVVRELVQLQGGSVWVEEAMSGGARFVVELPQGEAS
jgi:signal transduction histidine kinase